MKSCLKVVKFYIHVTIIYIYIPTVSLYMNLYIWDVIHTFMIDLSLPYAPFGQTSVNAIW